MLDKYEMCGRESWNIKYSDINSDNDQNNRDFIPIHLQTTYVICQVIFIDRVIKRSFVTLNFTKQTSLNYCRTDDTD